MLLNIITFALTTFISVGGQVLEVETDSVIYEEYQSSVVTDVGNPDNLYTISEEIVEPEEVTTVSGGDASTYVFIEPNNDEEIALLATAVELLAENSSSTTGTLNSSVLTLMDRMIDSYPLYYKYAGFRTDNDDAYASTLYIAKDATVNGNDITFSEDCIAVTFRRYQQTGVSSYVYFTVTDSPNASVDIGNRSIVYTNCIKGYPALGTKSVFSEEWLWIGVFVVVVIVIFVRSIPVIQK